MFDGFSTLIECAKIHNDNDSINFGHKHAGLDPHVHHGYFHNENDGKKGATRLTKEEKKMVESVEKVWHAYLSRR